VAGFSITTQAVGVRRAIGYVPQAVSVDGSLTGYENLLIFAKLYDLPHHEQQVPIWEALEFMGLTAPTAAAWWANTPAAWSARLEIGGGHLVGTPLVPAPIAKRWSWPRVG
jgi:hypothetical protein